MGNDRDLTTGDRIVLGDDGSIAAGLAWDWIMCHRWPAWSLDVVNAAEVYDLGLTVRSAEPLADWEPTTKRSLDYRSEIETVRFLTKPGDPRAVLREIPGASLMVVGSGDLGSFKATVAGSTADWLLHQPPAPLVIVRRAEPTKSVLFCVDGSSHALRSVEAAAALPWMTSATAHVLAVNDGRVDTAVALQSAAKVLEAAAIRPVLSVGYGRPPRAILDTIESLQPTPDLVVLGTRGLTTFGRLWFGSTAAAVARHCTRNVFVASMNAV